MNLEGDKSNLNPMTTLSQKKCPKNMSYYLLLDG